jgi:hypothetical protein
MDIPFIVHGVDEADVRRQVTPDYIMENVTDDWPALIRNVTIRRAQD